MAIHIINALPSDPHLHQLIHLLDEYLYKLYPPEDVFVVDFNSPELNKFQFVVAYEGHTPVGCGAIKPLNDTEAELKRFFVHPNFRNKGVAAIILDALEARARVNGYQYLKLETGLPQFEAIQLYLKHQFYNIERYGEYVNCESSVCMEKRLY